MMKIGLMGYGKAGKAVAKVLNADPRFALQWVMRRSDGDPRHVEGCPDIPVTGHEGRDLCPWLDEHPIDALVDFSVPDTVYHYGEQVKQRGIMLVTAISAYTHEHLTYLKDLGKHTRVMSSPNITLGINFLLMAASLLRNIAPFADVEIVEQHFRDKPEVSGTARKIAETLNLDFDRVTSLRMGGIVGHHEVIFGFPHQTVRLIHESIRREAFGTGAAFALQELAQCDTGFYTMEELMLKKIRQHLLQSA
ncbi:MAG TPA: dihydrodipicolinate reductase C-terminal domain-containing protein [Macromonas sp.]|nr:dihydrodipicolinate reductase C-terminal domain-containing protein [Macromonas sp.]